MKTIIGVIFLIFAIILGMSAIEKDRAIFYDSLSHNADHSEFSSEEETLTLSVTITGEIQKPGTYEINYGEYLETIIEKAGGITSIADTDCFDYYFEIEEDLEIYIPPITEESKISINKAELDDLMQLQGIGKVIGNRILTYRFENGDFRYLEEIMKVEGIGKSIYYKIKDRICL